MDKTFLLNERYTGLVKGFEQELKRELTEDEKKLIMWIVERESEDKNVPA
ncbi:hypothetical protein U8V97_11645 [Priestia filamentosa]